MGPYSSRLNICLLCLLISRSRSYGIVKESLWFFPCSYELACRLFRLAKYLPALFVIQ
ncbi:MAG: hypothetical protein ACJAZP_002549 [Psychromonas sp.]|jgi:hypothetical protein